MTKTLPAAAVLFSASISGCANIDVDHSAENFDEATYAGDLSECRGGPAALFALDRMEHAVIGSLYGLVYGAHLGASAGNTDKGAIIGAIVGSLVGAGAGASDSIDRHDAALARCLRDKGYAAEPV